MFKWSLVFLLPLLATAQLKEFEVSEMERPDVAIVQANAQFPDDALLLVYSSLKDLNFRSSLGGIDKVSYNPQSNRYEILFKPNKQMLFVYANNFVEQKIETFNPNPKDVFYYKVEEKQQAVVNTKPGTLKIVTEPSGADVFINGIQTVNKTPFTGELNPGSTRVKLQKVKHETIDTTVVVKTGEPTVLTVQMKPTTLWVNITSTPSSASVTLDGISRGTTPASFEMDLTDRTKCGNKQLQLTLTDYETITTTIELKPSSTPGEFKYSLQKQTGSFTVNSSPEGAQVFIGGQYKGTTPLQGSMEVGQYEVEVKLDGYTAPKQNLTVSKNGGNELSFTMRDLSALPTAIGQLYGGGIVFYLDGNGGGLIAAPTDQSTGAEWGCYGTEISGADGTALGTGNQNTIDIEAGCTAAGTAADLCANLALNGYNDWFLPSIDELRLMYHNLHTQGLGNFQPPFEDGNGNMISLYWSSTEYNYDLVVHLNFFDGSTCHNWKTYEYYVRAVRAF